MRIAPPSSSDQRAKSKARDLCARAQCSGPGCAARPDCVAGRRSKQDLKIAHLLSIVPRNAARWRSRFLHDGITGLEHDAPRPGRTPSISPELVRIVRVLQWVA
jgi:hypothetical protein